MQSCAIGNISTDLDIFKLLFESEYSELQVCNFFFLILIKAGMELNKYTWS